MQQLCFNLFFEGVQEGVTQEGQSVTCVVGAGGIWLTIFFYLGSLNLCLFYLFFGL